MSYRKLVLIISKPVGRHGIAFQYKLKKAKSNFTLLLSENIQYEIFKLCNTVFNFGL